MRQRPDPLPRGVLPLREGLPREDGAVGPARAPPRRLLAPRPGHRLRGGAARGGLPLRGPARARRARRRDRRRLQLRLRAGRRAAPPDGRGPERGDPPRRRGPQPARPRAPDLLARAPRGGSRRRCATGCVLQPGDLFADLALSVEELLGIVARRRRGPARRATRSPRSSRRPSRSSTCASTGSRSSCATSRGSARRASRSWTIRSWTSTSRSSASRPSSRCSARTSPASSSGGRPASGSASSASIPARALAPVFRAGALDDPALGDADAARGDRARPRPRAGPHLVDLAAAAVPAREPQGHDRADGAHDLQGAREELRPDRARCSARCPTRTAATTSSSFPPTAS